MKNKLLSLLFVLVLCVFTAVPAFADNSAEEHVIDNADLLTGSEKSQLNDKILEICKRQSFDIVVVTVKSLDGKTPQDYADDYYDYNGFGYGDDRDGALLLVSMEDRDWYISTCGYGITVITDAGREYMDDQFKGDLSDGNYYDAFGIFADQCDKFITQAKTGDPYDISNLPTEPLSWIWIPVAIVIGMIISGLTVSSLAAKLKTVRFKAGANCYVAPGSMDVTESNDLFLYRKVDKTPIPKDDSSSSSGGSSTHVSSSGTTHGGGGGKF